MRKKKLRIAQINNAVYPVSEKQNKAIYSHVAHLVNGFTDLKHEVVLYGNKQSDIKGSVIDSGINIPEEFRKDLQRYEQWSLISDCYRNNQKNKYDIIHSHLTVMTPIISSLEKKTPTLISIHSPIEDWMIPLLTKYKDEKFISFSLAQRKQLPELNWYANIYHGVDTDLFDFNEKPEDYFLFIGRITKDKGAYDAIEACISTGVKLRIAGRSYSEEGYWQEKIEPYINGNTIRYIGEVSLEEKIPLIQNAKAIIAPTYYNEAFGYTIIEAMSCGTPVIAYPNGSVAEIVKDQKTGFLVNSIEEIAEAIKKIDSIDRKECRKRAELFFSKKKMIKHYESVYQRAIQEKNFKNKNLD